MYALVVFTEGDDSGKLSVVPCDWLKPYDNMEPGASGVGPTRVEWRVGQRAMWKTYKADVIFLGMK